jgi:hypothetical protein
MLEGRSEPLSNIVFDPRSGRLSFTRGAARQRFAGTLSGAGVQGRIDNRYDWSGARQGAGFGYGQFPMPVSGRNERRSDDPYNLSGVQAAAPVPAGAPAAPSPADRPISIYQPAVPEQNSGIEGRWSADCNGSKGTLEFSRAGAGWTGRLDLGSGAEALAEVSFDPPSGRISFVRPSMKQRYTGTVSSGTMKGRFDDAYDWSAAR